ncbi:MAG TPA: GAF domain-containing protein [Anaerolineae bacterium]|nr:GAF domain-containing protein [Anaerolineae bacterium]
MSIRVRLIVIIALVGMLPLLIASFWTTRFMETLAVASGAAALEEIGKSVIYDEALTIKQQVQAYLGRHPEVDPFDMDALQRNTELASIAVQPVGKTGYTGLIDNQGYTRLHVNPQRAGEDLSLLADKLPEFWAVFSGALGGASSEGYYDWIELDGTVRAKYAVLLPIEDTPLIAVATTYMDEFTQPTQQLRDELSSVARLTRQRFLTVALVTGVGSVGLAVVLGFWLTRPLQMMARNAERVIQGEWGAVKPLSRRDEIGDLSRALSTMTTRAQTLVQTLEQQVLERTESLERRARYLETTSRVAREAAAVLDIEILLDHVVTSIAEEFDFYHVGLFLVDIEREWLELRAVSSEGGRQQRARGYRVRLNAPERVAQVLAQGEYRVFRDVGVNAVQFDNPDLPETRSQVVFPLRLQTRLIGALDVQSRVSEAFKTEDVAILQSLADQVAVAISNATLFRQTQESAEAERRLRGELESEAWQKLLAARPDLAYRSTSQGVFPAADVWLPEMVKAVSAAMPMVDESEGTRLAIPIRVGGQIIGVVEGRKPSDGGAWTAQETTLLNALTEQLNATIDRARLYQDTQRRAARERVLREVTARVRSSSDPETVLSTLLREVGNVLGRPTFVRLGSAEQLSGSAADQTVDDHENGAASEGAAPIEGGQ